MSSETIDLPERAAAIKYWTRQALALGDDKIVAVSEFDCGKPTCPNRHTAIMVMSQEGQPEKISIHKPVADISEFDVLDACLEFLRNAPSHA